MAAVNKERERERATVSFCDDGGGDTVRVMAAVSP
jgi:hypothetical protein